MNFLSHYGLLAEPRNRRLIDRTTKLSTWGYAVDSEVDSVSIKTIIEKTNYHRLLVEFPDLTRQPVFGRETTRHSVVHHTKTTPGPPVFSKPRRLAPDRLKLAEAKFEMMLEQREIRPSKGISLHIVPNKDGGLRPCGDYRALNARTVPDRYSPPHIEDFLSSSYSSSSFEFLNRVIFDKCSKDKIFLVSRYRKFFSAISNAARWCNYRNSD
jgi:hypothetical protein